MPPGDSAEAPKPMEGEMQPTGEGFEVTLTCDFTRRHASLRPGAKGLTRLPQIVRPLEYTAVQFADVDLHVRWRNLRITDERWTDWKAREDERLADSLKNHVSKAILYVGARGGKKHLVIEYSNRRANDRFDAYEEYRDILDDLATRGLVKKVRA